MGGLKPSQTQTTDLENKLELHRTASISPDRNALGFLLGVKKPLIPNCGGEGVKGGEGIFLREKGSTKKKGGEEPAGVNIYKPQSVCSQIPALDSFSPKNWSHNG